MRKKLLFFYFFIFISFSCSAQAFAPINILDAIKITSKKIDSYFLQNGFSFSGYTTNTDSIIKDYSFKRSAKLKHNDSLERSISLYNQKENFCLSYRTTSSKEFNQIVSSLIKEGFFCATQVDTSYTLPRLFQFSDVIIKIWAKPIDSLIEYTFQIKRYNLPKPTEIEFAEDLLSFNSQESLRYYFGEKNVKKDFYYLSENKLGKCSVLFANTNRQVVFLWSDEINNCEIEKLFIGGQLMVKSAIDNRQNVAENLWRLKSGIRPGMSLYQLRQLNDAAFNFNGGKSVNTGMIFNDSTGKINFKKENIILGCVNCNDPAFLSKSVINSDEAIRDERIFFVHTIILNPLFTKYTN